MSGRLIMMIVGLLLLGGLTLLRARVGEEPEMPDMELLRNGDEYVIENLAYHFENRLRDFQRENYRLDPHQRTIVFAGDSITEGFDTNYYFPQMPVLNRGIAADGIWAPSRMPQHVGILNRFDETMVKTNPAVVFLLIGTNHLADENESVEHVFEGYVHLYDKIKYNNPDAQVVLHTIPPFGRRRSDVHMFNHRARNFNDMLREFAAEENIELIDLNAMLADRDGALRDIYTNDGIHLTPDAYDLWAAAAGRKLHLLAPGLIGKPRMYAAAEPMP